MRQSMAFLVVAVVCLAGVKCVWGDGSAQKTKLPLVTLTGADSQVKDRCYLRIDSEEEWIKTWQRHKGTKVSKDYNLLYDPLGLPQIDFGQCTVVAVFQGSGWNCAGLKAVTVEHSNESVTIRFIRKSYQTGGPDGGADKVTAYAFFVLPRSDKMVVLEEDQHRYIGDPPAWKVVAKLQPKAQGKSNGKTTGRTSKMKAFKGWKV
jgi:hypothetical protein